MTYVKGGAREPYCEHTLPGQPRQPASMCRICVYGEDLAAWKQYWQELIPPPWEYKDIVTGKDGSEDEP